MTMAMTTTRTRGDGALAPSPMTTVGLVIPAKAGTYWRRLAYAKAGTYPDAARPDRSTLSRRIRGVLSPCRERGIRALARLRTGRVAPRPQAIPGGHVIPAQAGTYCMRLAYAQAGTYPMPTQPHNNRHSGEGRNPEGAGASPAPQNPADVPLDRHFIRF